MEENNTGHLQIAEMLLMAEYEKAAELLTEHLEQSKKKTFDVLLKMGAQYTRN